VEASTESRDRPPSRPADSRHPERIIAGLLASIEERGYVDATVADVVRHARVSRRTFYEHFSGKDDALRALYADALEHLHTWIREALEGPGSWRDRVHAGILAFGEGLAAYPGLARTILLEMGASSDLAIEQRDQAHRGFDQIILAAAAVIEQEDPSLQPLAPDMATAVVGAIYEHLTRQVVSGGIDAARVADIGTALIVALADPTGSVQSA
jgi:AcrR family transcriptional regulator